MLAAEGKTSREKVTDAAYTGKREEARRRERERETVFMGVRMKNRWTRGTFF